MSRRDPGAESAAGASVARERLAAMLGSSGDAGNRRHAHGSEYPGSASDAGRAAAPSPGLLDVQTPPQGLPAGHLGGLAGHRRDGRPPLSARLRARTGVRAAALLGVLAAVLGGCFWWQAGTGGPRMAPLSESAPATEAPPAQSAAVASAPPVDDAGAGAGTITVHVAGAVARPGVVQLPAGSRLYEAIAAAGGATDTAEQDRLNLAAVLEDGQKVLVPIRGEPDQAGASDGGGASPPGSGAAGTSQGGGGKINLNTAGLEELGTLPRVGPVLAQRIVDWRTQHGRFKTVQELDAVDGIGPKLLEALLPLVSV
ncbi:helix-hairpin-helix domain-containing protein [Arthrobacter humicola]|uniref:helix-hairpin-helix domain-containing protein n=1 Tax=Arthrobacter humicola TaxID=409291 RepID=UPI0031DE354B